MLRTILSLLTIAAVGLTAPDAAARSRATAWLVDEQLEAACPNGKGTIDPSGVIERDLDGDGRSDLIISHDAIACGTGLSAYCGMQVCSVIFYLRRGDLLRQVHEMLGSDLRVGPGRVPAISMRAHGGGRGSVQWNGRAFK